MRLISAYTLCGFVTVWFVVLLLYARYYTNDTKQEWMLEDSDKQFKEKVRLRFDELDARYLQLNEEIKRVEKLVKVSNVFDVSDRTPSGDVTPLRETAFPPRPRVRPSPSNQDRIIPILMVACNRPAAVSRSLDSLLKYRPSATQFPIIVSQDCAHGPTEDVVKGYGDKVILIKQPDQSHVEMPPDEKPQFQGYYKVSRHYKFALGHVFDALKFSHAIIVEDDLDVSPDFFSYFSVLRGLLDRDPTIWCVSAWNDNGKAEHIDKTKSELLYRSDFFPGLGWMLKSELWKELKPKWPKSYWDDWMREPQQRKGRVCIRPEISRTYTFGDAGVSLGQYWSQHLQYIVLNQNPVDFSKVNISYLQQSEYDVGFVERVHSLPSVALSEVQNSQYDEVQVTYGSMENFELLSKQFGLMSDTKAGVPRMAYKGIVSFMFAGKRVHLTPKLPWGGYKP
eukprot:Em0010g928a